MSEPNNSANMDLIKIFGELHPSQVNDDPGSWLPTMRDKLFTMFCSPMKEEYTHEAFKWVSNLCLTFRNLSWISLDSRWTEEEIKIFNCIARLSLNELDILLPLIKRHVISGEEPDLDEGKLLSRSANPDDYDRFGDHLVITECVVRSLLEGMESSTKSDFNKLTRSMKSGELSDLLRRLKEIMTNIMEYLEIIHRNWQQVGSHLDDMRFHSFEGALRIVCIWISEDPGSFIPEYKRFLIDLLIEHLMIEDYKISDIVVLALHSICAEDDESKKILKETKDHVKALNNYLKYVEEQSNTRHKSTDKTFKLRCGIIKDLMK